jgi:hypothetical protein
MNKDSQERILDIHLMEYDKLKEEQALRIGFRDNLLYVTLVVFGGVFSYAIGDVKHYEALLVLPLACCILGWTYLLNDEKISSIKSYLKDDLDTRLKLLTGATTDNILGWENYQGNKKSRRLKKTFQLFINLMTFCFSGLGALIVFINKEPLMTTLNQYFVAFGVLILITLGAWFLKVSDLSS